MLTCPLQTPHPPEPKLPGFRYRLNSPTVAYIPTVVDLISLAVSHAKAFLLCPPPHHSWISISLGLYSEKVYYPRLPRFRSFRIVLPFHRTYMQAPMQSSSPRPPLVYSSFGERRSISHDLARFSLDLGPARPGASRPAHTVPYPSPPMSHSPPPLDPLSPKQDARRPSGSITLPHEIQGILGRAQEQLPHSHEHLQGPVGATVSSEGEGFPAPFPSLDNGESSHPHLAQISSTSSSQRSPFAAQPSFLPPQLPRRTKSHVASACVNCKKAHLACDGTFSIFLIFYLKISLDPFISGFIWFYSIAVWLSFGRKYVFRQERVALFRSRRSAGLLFWHELYFFWGCRFRHKSYHPRTGCRDIGVYPMGSSDNSIVGFRELIRLREVVNSLISALLAFFLIGQRTAIVELAVPCFICLCSSLLAPVLPIEICQGLARVLASHDLMQD